MNKRGVWIRDWEAKFNKIIKYHGFMLIALQLTWLFYEKLFVNFQVSYHFKYLKGSIFLPIWLIISTECNFKLT